MIDLEPFVKVKTHEAPKRESWLRRLINPKQDRPENCICDPDEFRYWTAQYEADCPCHGHHTEDDCLASKTSDYNFYTEAINSKGFTLVELILVIMIIGFLAFAIVELGGASWLKPVIEFFTFS